MTGVQTCALPISTTYRFRIPDGSRRSFNGLELWVEGIDSSHVIGAQPWTGVAAA